MMLRLALAALCAAAFSSVAAALTPVHSMAHRCCVGQTITTQLWPMSVVPFWTYDSPGLMTGKYGGFIPRAYDMIAEETGFTIAIQPGGYGMSGFYDWFGPVVDGQVDAMHGMLTQWSFNTTVSNTIPFLETPVKAILHKTKVSAGMFVWVQPFETDLWMAIIAFVFFSGFWIILLNYLTARTSEDSAAAEEAKVSIVSTLGSTMYHAWAIFLAGEDYEWISWPARVFRLGLLLFVVIISAAYTGNMTNFFLKSGVQIHGPTSLSELKSSKACTLIDNDIQPLTPFVNSVISGQTIVGGSGPPDMHACITACTDALKAGDVDVVLAYEPFVQETVLNSCDEYAVAPSISLTPMSQSLFFRTSDPQTVARIANLNIAISFLKATPQWIDMLRDEWMLGTNCPSEEIGELDAVKLSSMSGLFIVTLSISLVAIAAAVFQSMLGKSEEKPLDHTATEGEMLRQLLSQMSGLEEKMDGASVREHLRSATKDLEFEMWVENNIGALFDRYDVNCNAVLDSSDDMNQLTTNAFFSLCKFFAGHSKKRVITTMKELEAKIYQSPMPISKQTYRDWFCKSIQFAEVPSRRSHNKTEDL